MILMMLSLFLFLVDYYDAHHDDDDVCCASLLTTNKIVRWHMVKNTY